MAVSAAVLFTGALLLYRALDWLFKGDSFLWLVFTVLVIGVFAGSYLIDMLTEEPKAS